MKVYFKALLIGLILWAIINPLLYARIVDFAIRQENTLYIHLYYLFTYLIIGFTIGWYGKSKGWVLGLLFGIIVVASFCISPFLIDMFKPNINDIGIFATLGRIILSPSTIIVIVCSTFGGFLGNRIRKIRNGKNQGTS
jgi:hypothetical protein